MLRDAFSKLRLNDASFYFEPERSDALGRGFRCGFLGVLHLDIIRERLIREYGVVPSSPRHRLRIALRRAIKKNMLLIRRSDPRCGRRAYNRRAVCESGDFNEHEYLGQVMQLLNESRGISKETQYVTTEKVLVRYEAPFAEVVVDFYDESLNRRHPAMRRSRAS